MLNTKENGTKEISSSTHSRLPLLESPDFKHIERHTKKAIRELSEELYKNYPAFKPGVVFVVVSSPWYSSETKVVKVSRKDPFVITKDLLEGVMADEVELFLKKIGKNSSAAAEEMEILDKEIMRFVVNGYPIKNPLKKTTSELSFSIYLSAVKKNFLNNLQETLSHFFGSAEIKIVSEPFALYKILSEMVNSEEGFLVVDVGGEVTEVYLIRNGILEDVKNFSWGENLVVRRLASSMKVELGEALSFFKADNSGDLKEGMSEKIAPAVEGVCTEWQNFLSESLSEMGKNVPLPQTLILLGGIAGSDVLKKCVNSPDFSSFTILGKPFNVVTLPPESFESKISFSGVDKDKMTTPLLLALGASRYAEKV